MYDPTNYKKEDQCNNIKLFPFNVRNIELYYFLLKLFLFFLVANYRRASSYVLTFKVGHEDAKKVNDDEDVVYDKSVGTVIGDDCTDDADDIDDPI